MSKAPTPIAGVRSGAAALLALVGSALGCSMAPSIPGGLTVDRARPVTEVRLLPGLDKTMEQYDLKSYLKVACLSRIRARHGVAHTTQYLEDRIVASKVFDGDVATLPHYVEERGVEYGVECFVFFSDSWTLIEFDFGKEVKPDRVVLKARLPSSILTPIPDEKERDRLTVYWMRALRSNSKEHEAEDGGGGTLEDLNSLGPADRAKVRDFFCQKYANIRSDVISDAEKADEIAYWKKWAEK